jgi:hypothetical protein
MPIFICARLMPTVRMKSGEDMLDAGADDRLSGIGATGRRRHVGRGGFLRCVA